VRRAHFKSARSLFHADAYIIAPATDVSIVVMPNAATASRRLYSSLNAPFAIFSGLQENVCWSITKGQPEKTKSVESDNTVHWRANNFRTPE
jgi:hypothetical protein